MSSLTAQIKKRYKKYVHKKYEYILHLEETEKIRDDFIDFYTASLSSKSLMSRAYSSKSKPWYHSRIIEWGNFAKKYNAFQIFSKKADETIDDLGSVNDILTIFDGIRNFLPWVTVFFTVISVNISQTLSTIFLIISVILVILNWGLEIIRIHSDEIQDMIKTLIFKDSDILLENGSLPDKEKLYGPYIWNRSLCNPSTISVFIFLLFLKKIRPTFYGKIKETGLRLFPLYMSSVTSPQKSVSSINFTIFYLKNRKPPTQSEVLPK
ncbi:MAG: hypothetical protein ABR999_08700 [Methanoregula sp.]|jgi:hypothetical protein|uniref:hypothetical protein n=1 Tax=Methanoregula sp. TaxID=2052170 RepID=UPI003D0CFF7F